jgi:hypothetical protein
VDLELRSRGVVLGGERGAGGNGFGCWVDPANIRDRLQPKLIECLIVGRMSSTSESTIPRALVPMPMGVLPMCKGLEHSPWELVPIPPQGGRGRPPFSLGLHKHACEHECTYAPIVRHHIFII